MTGLELSRRYYEEVGRPMLDTCFPFLADLSATGRVGEGSECFDLDDALSRDHDFGPGFCIWLDDRLFCRYGKALSRAYWALPDSFSGIQRPESEVFHGRVGVFSITGFFSRFLGTTELPQTEQQWFSLPQEVLAFCTNGVVFSDPPGTFSTVRKHLLAYYPEQVRLKKLAAHCAIAAQAGQYNYPRCIQRDDRCAAIWALQQFLYHYQAAVFLLNRCYQPYGKLSCRALCRLPLLGQEAAPFINSIASDAHETQDIIEHLCALMISTLNQQGLSRESSSFLLHHGVAVQSCITSAELSALPLMVWKNGWQF